jgi:hypothetical protein
MSSCRLAVSLALLLIAAAAAALAGRELPSGVYLARLVSGGEVRTRSLALVR